MASGVQVADNVKDIYNEMKVVKNDADQSKRIRLVVFKINNSFIDVEEGEIYREEDLENVEDVFKFFMGLLKKDQCRYLLYDCHFETKETSRKEELVFVMWAPDEAPIKEKMNYASSKEAMRKCLTGIKHEVQANFLTDFDDFTEKVGKGKVISLEGRPVK